jgi:hypothetical protein
MVILRSNRITNYTPHVYGQTPKDLETQRNKRKRDVSKIKKVDHSKRSLRSSNLKIVPQDLVDSQWKTPNKLQPLETPNLGCSYTAYDVICSVVQSIDKADDVSVEDKDPGKMGVPRKKK